MLKASILIALLLAVVGIDNASAQRASVPISSDRLKSIVAGKVIKIAHRTDARPFSYVRDANDSEPVGYTIDLCKRVVASLERQFGIPELKIQWVPITTETRFQAVAGGDADLECGSSTVTLGRMKLVDFSNFVFIESTGLVVRTASIRHLKDVAGKKIAVIAGTTNERALIQQNEQRKLNAIVVPVSDRDKAIAAVHSGQVDGFAGDKLLLVGTRFKDGYQGLRLLPDDLSIEAYAIALPRGDWELRLAVNTTLAEIFRSGEIRKIFDRWFAQAGFQPGMLLNSAFTFGALPE